MVKIMENPIKIDDLGGFPPIFGNTQSSLEKTHPPHLWRSRCTRHQMRWTDVRQKPQTFSQKFSLKHTARYHRNHLKTFPRPLKPEYAVSVKKKRLYILNYNYDYNLQLTTYKLYQTIISSCIPFFHKLAFLISRPFHWDSQPSFEAWDCGRH